METPDTGILLPFVILTLASFVVGMMKDVSLGLHILAYSAAATLGSLLISSFIDFGSTIYNIEENGA